MDECQKFVQYIRMLYPGRVFLLDLYTVNSQISRTLDDESVNGGPPLLASSESELRTTVPVQNFYSAARLLLENRELS